MEDILYTSEEIFTRALEIRKKKKIWRKLINNRTTRR